METTAGKNAVSRLQLEGSFCVILMEKIHGDNAHPAVQILGAAHDCTFDGFQALQKAFA